MRKSTLLMGLLLAGGYAFAADNYVVPETSTKDAPKYYKIVSNRALCLKYRGTVLKGDETVEVTSNGETTTLVAGDTLTSYSVGDIGYGNMAERPYVGLHNLQYAAVSTYDSVVPASTLLWRFDKAEGNNTGKLDDGVRWVNIFQDDKTLYSTYGPNNFAELKKDGSVLYCMGLDEAAWNEENPNPFLEHSYVISNTPGFLNEAGTGFSSECFDMKNFCGKDNKPYWQDAYVYMAACWNAFSDFGITWNEYDQHMVVPDYNSELNEDGSANRWYGENPNKNNGSIYYFVEATAEEVAAAKAELTELERKVIEEQGEARLNAAKEAAIDRLTALANVPMIWSASEVNAAVSQLEGLSTSIENIKTMDDLSDAEAAINTKGQEVYLTLVDKANGKTVSFRNLNRLDKTTEEVFNDETFENEITTSFKKVFLCLLERGEENPETGELEYTYGLIAQNQTESEGFGMWTIECKNGEMKLRNKYLATGIYPAPTPDTNDTMWPTTENPEEAGLFQIYGVTDNDPQPYDLIPTDKWIVDGNNKTQQVDTVAVRENVVAIGIANSAMTTQNFFNLNPQLVVCKWSVSTSNYFSGSWWLVSDFDPYNSIDTIEAEQQVSAVKGIFDLQGRRIDAITRTGLYIIDGKKVIVKK
ncbi:MAG: hypothetical protein K2M97_02855 [Muribaculaceae bacterium]|nr:hypothetical protein [Muribaculaceae bacterium]